MYVWEKWITCVALGFIALKYIILKNKDDHFAVFACCGLLLQLHLLLSTMCVSFRIIYNPAINEGLGICIHVISVFAHRSLCSHPPSFQLFWNIIWHSESKDPNTKSQLLLPGVRPDKYQIPVNTSKGYPDRDRKVLSDSKVKQTKFGKWLFFTACLKGANPVSTLTAIGVTRASGLHVKSMEGCDEARLGVPRRFRSRFASRKSYSAWFA